MFEQIGLYKNKFILRSILLTLELKVNYIKEINSKNDLAGLCRIKFFVLKQIKENKDNFKVSTLGRNKSL